MNIEYDGCTVARDESYAIKSHQIYVIFWLLMWTCEQGKSPIFILYQLKLIQEVCHAGICPLSVITCSMIKL